MVGAPPPPPPSATTQIKTTKKWTITEEKEVKKDISNAKAFPFWEKDIHWSSVLGMQLSDNATAGVFFVEVEPDQYVVIKSSSALANEIFGATMARELGILAPRMHLIEYASPDITRVLNPATGKLEVKTVKTARDWSLCQSVLMGYGKKISNISKQRKAEKELNRAFFIKMEFITPACSLDNIVEKCHERSFDLKTVMTNETLLQDIGRMVVLDILLNNQDRIPVGEIWSNEGNSGNVLFQLVDETNIKIAAIDSASMPIYVEFQDKYMTRIEKFTKVMKSEENWNSEYIDSIVKFFEDNIGEKIYQERERKLIVRGIRETMDKIASMTNNDFEKLREQVERMKMGQDWADVWIISMGFIDVMFMESIANIFRIN
jgi:hypothetical protein